MSEHNSIQTDELPLTDELVVTFLQDNPEFFNRNPELINQLRLTDSQRGTVSLVERQQQQLRQKAHSLEEEITHLMSVATHNEKLFLLFSELNLRLIGCESATSLLDCLCNATTDLLSMSDLKLWFVNDANHNHQCITKSDCAGLMKNRLGDENYYFGRLQQTEQKLIFSGVNPTSSVVLVKLEHNNNVLGFLAISSDDAEHFDPRMDTLLLSQFRLLVSQLLDQKLLNNA